MARIAPIVLAAILVAAATPARAQAVADIYSLVSQLLNIDRNAGLTTFRSLLIPMGGLAEGMGTAYTAVSKDSSYFEANPASSSVLDFTELAVFHNNWIADTRIEGAVYTIRYKSFGFGLGGKWLYLPFTSYSDFGERGGAGYYSESMAGVNLSLTLFPGYYWGGLSLGATGKLAYRAMPVVDDGSTAGNNALAVMVDGGALTRFNLLKFYYSRTKNFAIGAALKNVGPPVQGDPLPTAATAGVAYSPLRPLTFSFDATKPINLADPSSSEALSVAAGALIEMTDFFKLQAGLLLKGGNPRISVGSTFDIELLRIAVNYTLDLTTQFTPLNRISIQASFGLGDLGRAELAKRVDSLYLSGLEAYARGDLDESIAFWSEAVRLDPTFDPARESLRAALASKSLKQTMGELQNIKP